MYRGCSRRSKNPSRWGLSTRADCKRHMHSGSSSADRPDVQQLNLLDQEKASDPEPDFVYGRGSHRARPARRERLTPCPDSALWVGCWACYRVSIAEI